MQIHAIRTDLFRRICTYLQVFGVSICKYPCQYLQVLQVFASIQGAQKCQSHRYQQIDAILANTNQIRTNTYKNTSKYQQIDTQYIHLDLWFQKVSIAILMFLFHVFECICMYIFKVLLKYMHIRTRVVFACICMYMYVYVCIVCIDIYCMYMYVLHVYACISNRQVFGYIHNTCIYIQQIHIHSYMHIHADTCEYIRYIHILTYLQILTLKKCKYSAVFFGQYIPISI